MKREMLIYHPNRFAHGRPYFQPLYNQFRTVADADGVVGMIAFSQIGQRFIEEHWNPAVLSLPFENRPEGVGRFVEEQSVFTHVARFRFCGRNIFDLSPALVQLLRLTDVDDVRWESIHLPYPSFYLWFGKQREWSFADGTYFADGAYIGNMSGEGIDVFLTTVKEGIDYSNPPSFVSLRDYYFYCPFRVSIKGSTVGETLANTVDNDEGFRKAYSPPRLDPSLVVEARQQGVTLIQPEREQSAQYMAVEERINDLPIFRQVLRLLINALCYLSSPSPDVVRRFPIPDGGIPSQQNTPIEAKRQRRRLTAEGYTEINFCGESLEREYGSVPSSRELAAHWRRGHWRNQACGPHRSEHVLMWIRPTLVRKDREAIDGVVGHVYRVNGDKS